MTQPEAPLSLVVSFTNASDQPCLAIIAKRTYSFTPGWPCTVAREQIPFDVEPTYHEAKGQGGDTAAKADSDFLCHLKVGTDVVVQGSAHSLRGPVPSLDVSVGIVLPGEGRARYGSQLRVYGDRRVLDRGGGRPPAFSAPLPFASMPLTYDRAFGGRDIWAEKSHPDPRSQYLGQISKGPPERMSRYVYPRNPAGRGYLVHASPEALAGIELPNIEVPWDPLTPERLSTDHIEDWPKAPVPGGFDWIEQSWFPRVAFMGAYRPSRCAANAFYEFRSGYLPPELFDVPLEKMLPRHDGTRSSMLERHIQRFVHGASPGLATPPLTGYEMLVLTGMHPAHETLQIRLPNERPQMILEPPGGRATEVNPVLRTVLVRSDDGLLTTVWTGSFVLEHPLWGEREKQVRHAVRWHAV
ncbi:MAG TPA: DUF2169 domain-containing protein [Polyangiaceae bacterium]|nr:DUF2169 domain-containing protein [Polyangiaceae bacterium]